ncbi:sulfotransferase [uncultured Maritimibacter sp.]|jgi:hypothetical protein|uniref:sulfotransferase n=1 Tax=uncultured Maritimibacter sp. TaxID=991866 RepID=UPI000B03AABF|nr:sulfotransferase [uncultured Maritimibacter sp.]
MVLRAEKLAPEAVDTDPKIFVIGMNRTGTTSLHRLFELSGVPSLHWRDQGGLHLMHAFMTNIALGLRPFDGFRGFRAFTDLSFLNGNQVIEGARFFRYLHRAYPDAYFLLNTRPMADWIASRLAHGGGHFIDNTRAASGYSQAHVCGLWERMRDTHEAEVETHFAGNPRFLRFDIATDDPQAIADWLAPDFDIDTAHWQVRNRRPEATTGTDKTTLGATAGTP